MSHSIKSWPKTIGFFCVLMLTCFFATPSFAQDSKGTDFWLAFPQNNGSAIATLFIASDASTSGTVTVPGLSFSQPFTVTPGAVTSVELPATIFMDVSDVIQNKGIHVTSGKEVTIYGLNRQQFTTDAYLALPTDVLGEEYINLNYRNEYTYNATQLAIVASQNNTTVTINPTAATDGHPAGTNYSIKLDQGQTYLLQNPGPNSNDLSGSIIKSDKPIAVFGSNQCANIPVDQVACDHIIEQLPPTSTWGKNFVTVPLKTRLNGDTFRFLASNNNTTVRVNGTVVATLNRGKFYETILTKASQITSTQPILVAQYSNGSSFDGVTSDPFMMLIPPYVQFLGDYTITTPASGFLQNFANIVVPKAAVGAIKLDGTTVPAADFSQIGSSNFYGAQVDLKLGAHTINGTSLRFGVFVYGFDSYDSYGYPGGQAFGDVTEVKKFTLTLEDGGGGVGGEKCFNAKVLDQDNKPVLGIQVDFNIKGANPAGSGFATTNSSGLAQYCYTGNNAGRDTIIGSAVDLVDTAYYEWKKEICGNGTDDDGDGEIDEGCPTKTWYRDADGDGYGDAKKSKNAETQPEGYVGDKTDCDDSNANVHPGATEICDNGKDDDCNGKTDDCTPTGTLWYRDKDGDGHGDPNDSVRKETQPEGYVSNNDDCNDNDAAIHPGATEVCGDGKDNNCNGQTDEGCNTDNTTWYRDADGDGFGNPAQTKVSPTQPRGYVSNSLDCNDKNKVKGGPEVCDGIDNDCDGFIDNGLDKKPFYSDFDGDGYGTPKRMVMACAAPPRFVANSQDCNDDNGRVYPGAPELCDGRDNDCDGTIDEGFDKVTFYHDFDKDGYGNDGVTLQACAAPLNYVAIGGDCNDRNGKIHPGAAGPPNDGIDNNCNGLIDEPLQNVTTQKGQELIGEQELQLQLSAAPNPATHYFTLRIKSASTKAVQLRIVDAVGRVVETRQNIAANTTLTVGHNYRPSVYFAEVMQDGRKATLKLLKTSQ